MSYRSKWLLTLRSLGYASVLLGSASSCGLPADGSSLGELRGTVMEVPISMPDLELKDSESRPPAGHAWVIFGNDTVVAEVAATADERSQGLMYRDEVPDGTGMLFVFTDNQVRSFWMANTYVALDIAYMDPSYVIVDIVPMEPLVTDSYPSAAPAMFGLEVRQGWFQENSIRIGDSAEIVFGVRPRR